MEPSLKNVASTAEERLWESSFEEKLKEDVLYYRDCALESLSKLPENARNQADKWLKYLLGIDPETVEGKMERNDHLSALIEGMTLRKLMGIHADSDPPKPSDPIPPVPKTFLDEIEEELADTTAFEEDCSDAWGQELAGGGGGGDAGNGRGRGPQMAKTPKDERAYLADQSPPERPGASFNLHSMPTAKRDGWNDKHGGNLPGRGHFVGPQMAKTHQDERNYRATQSPPEHPRANNFHSMPGDKKREGWNVRHGGNIPERRRFGGPQMAKIPNGDRTYLASQIPPEHSAASFNLHSMPTYKKREGWNVRHGENIPGTRRFVGPQLAKPPQDERTYLASYTRPEYTGIFNVPAMPANKNVKDWNERTDSNTACSHAAGDVIMNSLQCRRSEEFGHRQWRLASDAAANRVAADLHARRRPPGVRETSEGTYDYLLDLVECSLRDEAIEVIEFLLDDMYEDIRKDPENDGLWEFPEAVIREQLLLRQLDIINHAKRERTRRESYPWGMPPSQQHFGQEPPSCKCPCHTNIPLPPILSNMSYMDFGNTWAGGNCEHKSHMDLGKRYKSYGMDRDQYTSRIRSQEKMVTRGTQPREKMEPGTANMAGYAKGHNAFAHELKTLGNKWESLGQSYRGRMKTFTTSKARATNMRIPCHKELDGLANETRMKQMHHSEMNKYYGKERPQPRECHHAFQPVRQ